MAKRGWGEGAITQRGEKSWRLRYRANDTVRGRELLTSPMASVLNTPSHLAFGQMLMGPKILIRTLVGKCQRLIPETNRTKEIIKKKRRLAEANRRLPVSSKRLIRRLTVGGHARQQ